MKKIFTIILLSISLSGFSQTMKGDWVITPTVGWNSFANNSGSNFMGLGSSNNYKLMSFQLLLSQSLN